jgi:hypothetical protein
MKFLSFWTQSEREQSASIDGINLFFGALLGANLGTATNLVLQDYVKLIVLLAVMVILIRVAAHAMQRLVPLLALAGYVALVFALYLMPAQPPEGMTAGDLHRLLATIVVWIAATVLVIVQPTKDRTPESDA